MDIMPKQKLTARTVPIRRTEKTYRIVLSRFDPETGNYKDVESVRIEAGKNDSTEQISERFLASVTGAFTG